MGADDILFAPIAEVAARYRDGSLSPVAVTELALARIAALNPAINAFITVTAAGALAAAQRAEQELRRGKDRGPLHGIPIALKDLIDTAGVRTTCGARILADHVPQHNAGIVDRLQAAGAVLVGKTNLLEFAYGIVHPDFGPTWNPWGPDRTAGGSSGGSAAAVAAGMCYAAVGTDTGGSIRIPAAYCGVAGLKPTYGLVSTQGIFPLSWSLDHAGPIPRTSADAALLFGALLGQETAPIVPANLRGLRLVVLADHRAGAELEPAVVHAFDDACHRAFPGRGCAIGGYHPEPAFGRRCAVWRDRTRGECYPQLLAQGAAWRLRSPDAAAARTGLCRGVFGARARPAVPAPPHGATAQRVGAG